MLQKEKKLAEDNGQDEFAADIKASIEAYAKSQQAHKAAIKAA